MPSPHDNLPRGRGRARASDHPRTLAQFAAETATSVGHWLAAQRRRRIDVGARSKHVGDPVTDLDVAGERRLRALIARRWPTHGFLGEETGAEALDRAHVWVVDPIDGTANFARDLQPWGVSIACMREGRPVAGAVYASADEVTVVAARAGGVRVDGKRVWMPRARSLGADSVVSTQWFRGTRRLPFLGRLLTTGTRIRVFGCTVVQLCDVVRGRLHANVQQQGRIWDIAAAGLIVEEAGGRFTGWNGAPIFPCGLSDLARHHPSIAASPAVHRQIVRLLDGLPVPRA